MQSEIHGINNTIHNLANLNPLSDVIKCHSVSMLRDENEILSNTVEVLMVELVKLTAENRKYRQLFNTQGTMNVDSVYAVTTDANSVPVNANVNANGESNVLINVTEQLVTSQETNQSVYLVANSLVPWNLPTSIAAEPSKNPTKSIITEALDRKDDQLLESSKLMETEEKIIVSIIQAPLPFFPDTKSY